LDPLLLGPADGERITDQPGRFLALKAGLERFDSYDPPADGGRSVEDVVIAAAGAGERLALGDSAAVIKVGAEGADGMLAVLETTVAPGFPGPVPHRHRQMLDSFWLLEGTLTLRLGERTVEAGPGSYAVAPPGAVHAFSNPGEAPVRMLNVMAPAGLEGYLRETTAAATTDPAEMARIAARYDFEPA
jgi:mannose-6-phosphate isomerase-like protein (cupin superfamily)